jgi:serine/threonine protein kinase
MDVKRELGGGLLSLDDGRPIGGGAEGVVYGLPDKPGLAAKIYQRGKVNAERVAKLRVMCANPPADPMRDKGHASIAWPIDLLSSPVGGEVIGFLMPRIRNAHPVSDFCDVNTRRTLFPLLRYEHLCRMARNLASAVGAIHERGYVIGDVKDLNVLATEEALVTLVDTDSFQVTEPKSGRVYRCPVGTTEFTPPELLSKNFEEIDRSPGHDLFGVAVLFFQLLMEGTLPFACVYGGPGERPDYAGCIASGYFPYGGNPLLSPQLGSPPFGMLHPLLQGLFRRCFVDGHADPRQRPDAAAWYRVLKESERALTVCQHNPQHRYFDHNACCPWCERARQLGPAYAAQGVADWDPFPSLPTATRAGHPAAQPAAPRRPAPSAGAHGPAPTPTAPPPSSFTASPATVSIGQPVTLRWYVPNAQAVRITDQSGRRVFVGNAPDGVLTIYPTRSRIYYLTASGVGLSLPNPVAVSVTPVPRPVKLNESVLELHQPTALGPVSVALKSRLHLNRISVKLSPLMKLKHHSPLNSYTALRRVSVKLKEYGQLVGAAHG